MLAALLWLAATLDADALVGQVVPPYPDGFASHTGTCVAFETGYDHACDFGFAVLEDARGTARFLLAERADARGDDGRPRWRVLDALPYPTLGPDEGLVFGQCQRDGVDDGGLVAVVDAAQAAEWLDRVARAWRLDPAVGRLVAVDVRGIRCVNEGWGYDG